MTSHRHLRQVVALCGALLLIVWAGAQLAARPALAATSCGHVGADYLNEDGGSDIRITYVNGIGCRDARSVMKHCIQHRHVTGWHASVASDLKLYLRKGSSRIVSRGLAGGAPSCFFDAPGSP